MSTPLLFVLIVCAFAFPMAIVVILGVIRQRRRNFLEVFDEGDETRTDARS